MKLRFRMTVAAAGLTSHVEPTNATVANGLYGQYLASCDTMRAYTMVVRAVFLARAPHYGRPVNASDYPPAYTLIGDTEVRYTLNGVPAFPGYWATGATLNGHGVYRTIGLGYLAPPCLWHTGSRWRLGNCITGTYVSWPSSRYWECDNPTGSYTPGPTNGPSYAYSLAVRDGTAADWNVGARTQPVSLTQDLVAEWLIERRDGCLADNGSLDYRDSITRGMWWPTTYCGDADHRVSRYWGEAWTSRGEYGRLPETTIRLVSRYALGCRISMVGQRCYSIGAQPNYPNSFGLNYTAANHAIGNSYQECNPGPPDLPGNTWLDTPTPAVCRYLRDIGDADEIVLALDDDGTTLSAGPNCSIPSQDDYTWELTDVSASTVVDAVPWGGSGGTEPMAHSAEIAEVTLDDEASRRWASWAPDASNIGCVTNTGVGEIRAAPASFVGGGDAFAVRVVGDVLRVGGTRGAAATRTYWNPTDPYYYSGGWRDYRSTIATGTWVWEWFPKLLGPVCRVTPGGSVGVVFVDPDYNRRVQFARSDDYGAGLDDAVRVSLGTCDTPAHDLQLAVTPHGVLVASWHESRGIAPGENCTRRYRDERYTANGTLLACPRPWAEPWVERHHISVSRDGGAGWTELEIPEALREYGPVDRAGWVDRMGGASRVASHGWENRSHALRVLWHGQAIAHLGVMLPEEQWVHGTALVQATSAILDAVTGADITEQHGDIGGPGRVDPFAPPGVSSRQQYRLAYSGGQWVRTEDITDQPGGDAVTGGPFGASHVAYLNAGIIEDRRGWVAIEDANACPWAMSLTHEGLQFEHTTTYEAADLTFDAETGTYTAPGLLILQSGVGQEIVGAFSACWTRHGAVVVAAHVQNRGLPRIWRSSGAPHRLEVAS